MNQIKEYWPGKHVLITGGTSGLGRALAVQLHNLGAHVVVVARHRPIEWDTLEGDSISLITGDVSDKNAIHRIHAEALTLLSARNSSLNQDTVPQIDVLFNNASALGPTPLRLLLDTDCEDFAQVLETNLIGPFRIIKLVLPAMILSQSGVVVNISSDAAVSAYPRWGAYGSSKAALDHLTRILQEEIADTGVRCLALDPGDMDTPLHFAAVPDADRAKLNSPESSATLMLKQIASAEVAPVRRSIR